jgi:hypothetical protein
MPPPVAAAPTPNVDEVLEVAPLCVVAGVGGSTKVAHGAGRKGNPATSAGPSALARQGLLTSKQPDRSDRMRTRDLMLDDVGGCNTTCT